MFVCGDCGAVFEKPAKRVETIWTKGRSEQYVLGRCPECGSGNFEEGVKCGVCGEIVSNFVAERSCGQYVCEKCICLIGYQAENALEQLFTPSELNALRIYIENIYMQGGHLV